MEMQATLAAMKRAADLYEPLVRATLDRIDAIGGSLYPFEAEIRSFDRFKAAQGEDRP